MFRVSRGVLIGVFRLGKDRGEVQVKHWERLILILLRVTAASVLSSPTPAECLDIVWSIWSSHDQVMIKIKVAVRGKKELKLALLRISLVDG